MDKMNVVETTKFLLELENNMDKMNVVETTKFLLELESVLKSRSESDAESEEITRNINAVMQFAYLTHFLEGFMKKRKKQ